MRTTIIISVAAALILALTGCAPLRPGIKPITPYDPTVPSNSGAQLILHEQTGQVTALAAVSRTLDKQFNIAI